MAFMTLERLRCRQGIWTLCIYDTISEWVFISSSKTRSSYVAISASGPAKARIPISSFLVLYDPAHQVQIGNSGQKGDSGLISRRGGYYESAFLPQSSDRRSWRQRLSAYRRLACEFHSGAGQRAYGAVDPARCAADGRGGLRNSEQAEGMIAQ